MLLDLFFLKIQYRSRLVPLLTSPVKPDQTRFKKDSNGNFIGVEFEFYFAITNLIKNEPVGAQECFV